MGEQMTTAQLIEELEKRVDAAIEKHNPAASSGDMSNAMRVWAELNIVKTSLQRLRELVQKGGIE